jgi:hypothetical protein
VSRENDVDNRQIARVAYPDCALPSDGWSPIDLGPLEAGEELIGRPESRLVQSIDWQDFVWGQSAAYVGGARGTRNSHDGWPGGSPARHERRWGHRSRLRHPPVGSKSIGRLRGFQGNYGCFVRAYAYICSLGAEGLQDASETAVLNANYLLARLREHGVAEYLPLAYGELCMHEFVLSGGPMRRELQIRTLDLAKRLLDFGFHPPTVYFPLLVEEALMVEPTETETRETLDAFADAIAAILREAAADPEIARTAPHATPVRRLDEVTAAKRPVIRQALP